MFCFQLLVVIAAVVAPMVPIEWSSDGAPYILIQVNGASELRPIDTGSSHFLVHSWTTAGYIDAHVFVAGMGFLFNGHEARTTIDTDELTYPIGQISILAARNDLSWLAMTPQSFHIFRHSNPFNGTSFCEDPSEARMIPVGPGPGWYPFMMNNVHIVIDSMSVDIQLPNDLFESFHAEVLDALADTGYNFEYTNSTGAMIVHGCNLEDLDTILPELDFVIATRSAEVAPVTRWFVHSAVPHHVRLSAKDYMRNTPHGFCHLGVVRQRHLDDPSPVLGSALFRSHAVSFNRMTRSMIICRAAQ